MAMNMANKCEGLLFYKPSTLFVIIFVVVMLVSKGKGILASFNYIIWKNQWEFVIL